MMDKRDSNYVDRVGKQARGGKELKSHLDGGRLSSLQAIYAKCYDCMGYYQDGKIDCKCPKCPLYQFMPYREEPDPRQKRSKNLSDEQRQALSDRLKKHRQK